MYETIYVPLDNSDHSNVSAELGLSVARRLGARLVGSHAYAAALHDVRFKQMEFTLPDEYKDETELEKQRRIHDSLIARGLTLISDSYLQRWQLRAVELDVPFEGKHFDGKNFQVIVDDIRSSSYDLVVLGALGQGAVRDSEVGSVCERVLRRIRVDALVVRDLSSAEPASGGMTVCIDGSPHSYGALRTACELARSFDRHVEVVTVADDESGDLLREHLELARRYARDRGVSASATVLDGAPVEAILAHITRVRPWLLAAGRLGIDADDPDDDIGSVAERLVRRASCNVLVSSRAVAASDLR
jgi:nucleotide-binding universal stress UspA family protein